MKDKRISAKKIFKLLQQLFRKVGYSRADANSLSEALVMTSLRGVDSHGIRLTPHYIAATQLGRIDNQPHFSFKSTGASTGTLDARHGHGILSGQEAMRQAIVKAKKSGVGVVAVKNSTHFGAAAIYTLAAAKANMIGLSFTNTDALVAPTGGREGFLGTNPICFAAPCAGEDPFCLDMATSTVAWNKIMVHRGLDKQLEKNWAIDKNGAITTDPHQAVALFPLGGYKGYGLGLMVEILCSLLSGMPFGPNISTMFPVDKRRRQLGHFFIAIDVKRFVPVTVFKKRLRALLISLRRVKTGKGTKSVLVAGDKEKHNFVERSKQGIPVSEMLITTLNQLAKTFKMQSL